MFTAYKSKRVDRRSYLWSRWNTCWLKCCTHLLTRKSLRETIKYTCTGTCWCKLGYSIHTVQISGCGRDLWPRCCHLRSARRQGSRESMMEEVSHDVRPITDAGWVVDGAFSQTTERSSSLSWYNSNSDVVYYNSFIFVSNNVWLFGRALPSANASSYELLMYNTVHYHHAASHWGFPLFSTTCTLLPLSFKIRILLHTSKECKHSPEYSSHRDVFTAATQWGSLSEVVYCMFT